ncbi:MAG: tripartite tricarboxylate transporter TctB family protein [Pseudomonadota bacterium]
MSDSAKDDVQFEGEEAGAGYASPTLDLIATAFLVALSIAVMAGSVALPVPGDLVTAPGLLPFLVAASLFLMALGLGASAVARRRAGIHAAAFADRDIPTDLRSLALAGAVAIYIAALQLMAFQYDVVVGGARYSISAFEPATIITLAVIIHLSWRGPIWITCLISVVWTLALSIIFQKVFNIPLPGTF